VSPGLGGTAFSCSCLSRHAHEPHTPTRWLNCARIHAHPTHRAQPKCTRLNIPARMRRTRAASKSRRPSPHPMSYSVSPSRSQSTRSNWSRTLKGVGVKELPWALCGGKGGCVVAGTQAGDYRSHPTERSERDLQEGRQKRIGKIMTGSKTRQRPAPRRRAVALE
jgi:hypothetical protein